MSVGGTVSLSKVQAHSTDHKGQGPSSTTGCVFGKVGKMNEEISDTDEYCEETKHSDVCGVTWGLL